jgi:tRNA G46 methylase TrmB
MRISVPNVLHAVRHPWRATRYLLYRDRIPYRRIGRYLPKDPVIVEAGAHNGANTAEMADFWPNSTIHAFEPVPSAVAAVRAKAAKYGSRVQCHQLALGGQDAAMEMHVSGDGLVGCCQSSSLLPPTKAHSR